MKEKKAFTIPRNVRSDFEIMKNVTARDTLFLLPPLLVDIPVLFAPISLYIKVPIITVSLLFPIFLIWFRPVRENIPFWQHARDIFTFATRQKTYYYRKEIEEYETFEPFEPMEAETASVETRKTAPERAIIRTKPDSVKVSG